MVEIAETPSKSNTTWRHIRDYHGFIKSPAQIRRDAMQGFLFDNNMSDLRKYLQESFEALTTHAYFEEGADNREFYTTEYHKLINFINLLAFADDMEEMQKQGGQGTEVGKLMPTIEPIKNANTKPI